VELIGKNPSFVIVAKGGPTSTIKNAIGVQPPAAHWPIPPTVPKNQEKMALG
jgi:hypothetical protein